MFHVSMLQKYLPDPSHVIQQQEVHFDKTLTYEEVPIDILDWQVKKLRSKDVPSVKVLWRNNSHEEATWEAEEAIKTKYPHLFESRVSIWSNLGD